MEAKVVISPKREIKWPRTFLGLQCLINQSSCTGEHVEIMLGTTGT
jgi:hypothetical protein